jgi:hypothetical protein
MFTRRSRPVFGRAPDPLEFLGSTHTVILLCAVSCIVSLVSATVHAEGRWGVETVTSGVSAYLQTKIAIGPDGSAHIAAAQPMGFNTPLMYAHKIADKWSVEDYENYGNHPALGVDSQGSAHLAYYPTEYPPIRRFSWLVHHAVKNDDVWSDENVAEGGDPTLFIDPSDIVHLAYRSDPYVFYASNIGGTWAISTVAAEDFGDGTYDQIARPCVAVDSNGWAYVAYIRSTQTNTGDDPDGFSELKLATQTPDGWVISVIDTMGFNTAAYDNPLAVAMDGYDRLHIVYFDDSNLETDGPYLKYATNTSGTWTKSILLHRAYYPAIAVDKNNKVHIVYAGSGGGLDYANNILGNWAFTAIDTVSGLVLSDIAVDDAGGIHVSYNDSAHGLLKYAKYPIPGYAISGTVRKMGVPLAGVTISLSGTATDTTTTGSDGMYRFTDLSNGAYTVTPTSGQYTFSPLKRNVNIDGMDVSDQDFSVTLGGAMPTVTIKALDPNASEPGTDKGKLVVKRTGDTSQALTVYYKVAGSATNGNDYKRLSGKITIPKGKVRASLFVKPIDDQIKENRETVIVSLSKNAAYIIGKPTRATVTISDND